MMTIQSEFLEDSCWFPDSGATNHVTNDPNQLSISSEYSGSGKIHMGNGIGLSISHVGSNSFVTNSRVLHLKNLLLVPSITKNLISVSQFCTDNNVFFVIIQPLGLSRIKSQEGTSSRKFDRGLYRFSSLQLQNPCHKTKASYQLNTS